MQRDLERRLRALETSWFGSPKIAAHARYTRAIRAMSDEELDREIEMLTSGEDFLGPAVPELSDAESHRVRKDDNRAIRVRELLKGKE